MEKMVIEVPMHCVFDTEILSSYGWLSGNERTNWKEYLHEYVLSIPVPTTNRDHVWIRHNCPFCNAALIFYLSRDPTYKERRKSTAQIYNLKLYYDNRYQPHNYHRMYLICDHSIYFFDANFGKNGKVFSGNNTNISQSISLMPFARSHPEFFSEEGALVKDVKEDIIKELSPDEFGILLVEHPDYALNEISKMVDGINFLEKAIELSKAVIHKSDPRVTYNEILRATQPILRTALNEPLKWSVLKKEVSKSMNWFIFLALWTSCCLVVVSHWISIYPNQLPRTFLFWLEVIVAAPYVMGGFIAIPIGLTIISKRILKYWCIVNNQIRRNFPLRFGLIRLSILSLIIGIGVLIYSIISIKK